MHLILLRGISVFMFPCRGTQQETEVLFIEGAQMINTISLMQDITDTGLLYYTKIKNVQILLTGHVG